VSTSTRKTVLVVIGTRPEAIKLAPLVAELKGGSADIDVKVVATGQHRDMTKNIFRFFGIIPDVDLDIMTRNQSLSDMTASTLREMDHVYAKFNPDAVFVQGDTTTAMVASICAFYRKIKVFHVEAGLRTRDIYSPFPEEFNRRVISVVAELYFAPTAMSARNLFEMRIPEDRIVVTGNTGIDALRRTLEIQREAPPVLPAKVAEVLNKKGQKKLVLVTGHRRESFGSGMENICLALREIAREREDVIVLYPVHLNPNVQTPVYGILANQPGVELVDPVDYPAFVHLLRESFLVLTDSGGIQEEAPFLGKPVLVMRGVTERPEGVEAGSARLVGTETASIVSHTKLLLEDPATYLRMAQKRDVYGDGFASEKIVQAARRALCLDPETRRPFLTND
jgi:UDP-N-acetylglucosamine 2-epimerase (non-hydrolysing)